MVGLFLNHPIHNPIPTKLSSLTTRAFHRIMDDIYGTSNLMHWFGILDNPDVEILIIDSFPKGPYFPLLLKYFGEDKVFRLVDLAQNYKENSREKELEMVCFKEAYLFGGWYPFRDEDILPINDFAERMIQKMGLKDLSKPDPNAPIQVALLQRTGTRAIVNFDSLVSFLRAKSSESLNLKMQPFEFAPNFPYPFVLDILNFDENQDQSSIVGLYIYIYI